MYLAIPGIDIPYSKEVQDALELVANATLEQKYPEVMVNLTPDDYALIKMMRGAHFDDLSRVTLPSGKTITGKEMRELIRKVNSDS